MVIPVYDEEATVEELLGRVRAVELPGVEIEVVVVDDASTDSTPESLARPAREGGGAGRRVLHSAALPAILRLPSGAYPSVPPTRQHLHEPGSSTR